MKAANLEPVTRRPPLILAALTLLAVLGFLGVNRLVHRFREQEKALARHLYERGQQAQNAGDPGAAIADFRAALSYNRENSQYQLSLARALRDTGRTAEAETRLISLWVRAPQEGAVNLALGRLFAREQLLDKAVQYYHDAIYGFWPSDADAKRRDTQLELSEFLLQQKAYPQAQAELITMAPGLPRDTNLKLRVAEMFAQAHDYEHALALYEDMLRIEHGSPAALAGAGEAAFQLGRYRTAQGYLQSAIQANPANYRPRQLLQTATLILDADPFGRRISEKVRAQRVRSAFLRAGKRLDDCAKSKEIDLNTQSAGVLPDLKTRWLQLKPKLANLRELGVGETLDAMMDLVFEIEQQTETLCGSPVGLDEALLLLSRDRAGVDR